VDLSGLIFVALAVAWAAYLIPKALRQHDDDVRDRSIDRFSQGMRVLARREPVSARAARLVVESSGATIAAPASLDETYAARRLATHRATSRRRRVLSVLLLALAAAVVGYVVDRLSLPYVAIPVGLLVVWLVACRFMVRRERAWVPAVLVPTADSDVDAAETGSLPAVDPAEPAARDPKLWDPVPVTLPTYVSKPPARRSVRTIDLDSTGVWTSGRSEADSALAREAEAADRVRRTGDQDNPGEQAVVS
jgi:hypothetical protein